MDSSRVYNEESRRHVVGSMKDSREHIEESRRHVVGSIQGKKSLHTAYRLLPTKKNSLSTPYSLLSTEKGIALVMVLILSAIALAIMAGLIYMIVSGTQISGIQKRYKTALEAGIGGADITYQFIKLRGETTSTNSFKTLLNTFGLYSDYTTPGACTGTNMLGASFTGLAAKLNAPTSTWVNCDSSLTITPGTTSTYDITFQLGTGPTYTVYSKIVDTVEGNSGGDEGLLKSGVVISNPGEVAVKSIPYLYTIEIDAENTANSAERAKLSVLYQY
ncbi:MAG: hypothetical protein AABY78_08040 [Nitrospirota bacterium]